jgi:hypothetical protein
MCVNWGRVRLHKAVRVCAAELRCHTAFYCVLRCFTVLDPCVGPGAVRCSYGADTVRDVPCAPLWIFVGSSYFPVAYTRE